MEAALEFIRVKIKNSEPKLIMHDNIELYHYTQRRKTLLGEMDDWDTRKEAWIAPNMVKTMIHCLDDSVSDAIKLEWNSFFPKENKQFVVEEKSGSGNNKKNGKKNGKSQKSNYRENKDKDIIKLDELFARKVEFFSFNLILFFMYVYMFAKLRQTYMKLYTFLQ